MNILIQKLNARSSQLLLTKILNMTATQYEDYKRIVSLADKMVQIGFYTQDDRAKYLAANIKF